MGRIALSFIIALIALGEAAAQTAFAPAAIVNDSPITYYDIAQRASILAVGGGKPGPELNRAALEQLIDDKLRRQAGDKLRLNATGAEIADAATELAARQGLDRAGLVEKVSRGGASEDALIDLLTAQVIWRKVVTAKFAARATPSDVELDQEITLAASGQNRSFRISEIVVANGDGGEAAARARIQAAADELAAGADFATVAKKRSMAPSAANGGLVGWLSENALPGQIAEALGNMTQGQISQPMAVPGGVSIFRLEGVRKDVPDWARDTQVSMLRLMVPLDADASDDDIAAARQEAAKLASDAKGCEGAPVLSEEAVMERIPKTSIIKFPNSVQDAVRLLAPRQSSRPVRSEGSMDVFIVCDREGGVDQQARENLRNQIRTTRLTRMAEGYMQELRRDAVIERR